MKKKYSETGHARRQTSILRMKTAHFYELKQEAQKRKITCSKMADMVFSIASFWLTEENRLYYDNPNAVGEIDPNRIHIYTIMTMAKSLALCWREEQIANRKKLEDYPLHPNNLKKRAEK